jgi:hypothetical protein
MAAGGLRPIGFSLSVAPAPTRRSKFGGALAPCLQALPHRYGFVYNPAFPLQCGGSPVRSKSRPSRVMPNALGALPVRSAARLACATAARTTSPRVICRTRRAELLMIITIVGETVKKPLLSRLRV